jgi:hypothetical protein
MADSMNTSTLHESYWSRQLYACLREMALRDTNAVLMTLEHADAVERGRRYPADGLTFANKRWRAFYHCHEEGSARYENEHGHFHIFTDIGDQQWAHVAGLSIDSRGQPLQWFTVNRWVTDGPWLDREQLLKNLQTSVASEQESLSGRWLFAMLQLYLGELVELFHARDIRVQGGGEQKELEAILKDRSMYTLAARPIELQAMLERYLLH